MALLAICAVPDVDAFTHYRPSCEWVHARIAWQQEAMSIEVYTHYGVPSLSQVLC